MLQTNAILLGRRRISIDGPTKPELRRGIGSSESLITSFRVFLVRSSLRRNRSRFSILVGSDKGKCGLRNLVPHLIGPASPPGLHPDCHRGSADFHYIGVKTDFVPDEYRLVKDHSVHGHRRATAATPAAGSVCPGKVHLGHQPAAENVSGGIGIRGHGNCPNQRFTRRRVSRIGHLLLLF
jgi:hypothetical protein